MKRFIKYPKRVLSSVENFNTRMLSRPSNELQSTALIDLGRAIRQQIRDEYGYVADCGVYNGKWYVTVWPTREDMRRATQGYKKSNFISHIEFPLSEIDTENLEDSDFAENTLRAIVLDLMNNNSGMIETGPSF